MNDILCTTEVHNVFKKEKKKWIAYVQSITISPKLFYFISKINFSKFFCFHIADFQA